MVKWFLCVLAVFGSLIASAQNASDALLVNTKIQKKDTDRQTDLMDLTKMVFHIKPKAIEREEGKTVYFTLLPLALIPPGGGNALITSTQAGFYLGNRKSTYLSVATFAPYWNFGNQFGLPLRSEMWLSNNDWMISTDIRFLFYPQYTWGLGKGNSEDDKILVSYRYLRFHNTLFRRIRPYLYLGLGYHADYHIHILTPDSGLRAFSGYTIGTEQGSNSFSSSPSVNVLYDHRYSNSSILPISYIHLIYRINLTLFGSETNWSSIYLDFRKYLSLNANRKEQNVLAFRAFMWGVLGPNAPYLDLPSIGWDPYEKSGRGIEQNRYRGRSLLYFETEYRKDLTRNGLLGFVVFGNLNSASYPEFLNPKVIHPAGGLGLRIKVNKGTQTNLAIDYAISNSHSGFWFALGEAF